VQGFKCSKGGISRKIEASTTDVVLRDRGAIFQGVNLDGSLGSAESLADRGWGSTAVPVAALGDDVVLAEVETGETEVVGAQRRVRVDHTAEMAGDGAVVANAVLGLAANVVAERAHAGGELFEDDGLGLDVTDLLGDDPLGHLLQDEEALLDDLDGLGVTHELGVFLNDGLGE